MNAFVRAENAADNDATFDLLVTHFNVSNSISPSPSRIGSPLFTASVNPLKIHRHREFTAEDFLRGQHERPAVLKSDAVAGDGANSDFWSRQILQDRHRLIELAFEVANFSNDAPVRGVIAMAEIEPRDIHAGANQTLEHFVGRTGGSNGANNFCAAHLNQFTRECGRINEIESIGGMECRVESADDSDTPIFRSLHRMF